MSWNRFRIILQFVVLLKPSEPVHLKIATIEINPYVYVHHFANGTITDVKGPVAEITKWLSERFQFTYNFVEPSDGSFGAKINDSWNGMIRMAMDHEVDMIAAPLTPTYARSQVVDFTRSFFEEPLGIIIPAPIEADKISAVVKPFQIDVWALIIFSMFSVSFFLWFFTRTGYKLFRTGNKIGSDTLRLDFTPHFLFSFGILTSQANMCTATSHTTRVMCSAWCLTSVVLVYLYTGSLISYMTIPKLYPLVNSITDLATSNQLQLLVFKNTFFESVLLESDSGPYKILGDSLLQSPQNRLNVGDEGINKVLHGGYAFLVEKSFLETKIEENLKETGKCLMSLVKGEFYMSSEAFALPKNSQLTANISEAIGWLREVGLTNYWTKQYWPKENRCTTSKKQHVKVAPLKLRNLTGSFILYGAGMAISFLCFIIEEHFKHGFKKPVVTK